MQIAIIGAQERYEKNKPPEGYPPDINVRFFPRGTKNAEILSQASSDTQILVADAISCVDAELISGLPKLRLIQSEGVGYAGIDTAAATQRNIYVCNNKGINAGAVAEQAILLMLGLLRNVIQGDLQVRDGKQMEAKERAMVNGIVELGDCAVGLVGFGDIGQATAARLRAFGSAVYYHDVFRRNKNEEKELGITYLPLDELAAVSDFVSIHAAVTPETVNMINADFLHKMKPTAYIINTARGEIVDNSALRDAIINNVIAGAGLDTIFPEPTTADNPIVDLPENVKDRVLYSPHLGGITLGALRRGHANIWENVKRIIAGERPRNIVNGL